MWIPCLLGILLVAAGCTNEGISEPVDKDSEKKVGVEEKDETNFPVTVGVDGKSITIEKKPENIIPMSLDVAEIVLELTETENIAAITRGVDDAYLSTKSEKAKDISNRIASAVNIDPEEILSYDADLLLLTKMHGQEEDADTILSQVDVPIMSFSTMGTLEDFLTNISIIGKAIGEEEKAKELVAKMEEEIASIQQNIPENVDPPSVLVLSEVGPGTGPFMMGPGNISYDLIQLAGAIPAVDSIGLEHSVKASVEQVMKMDPDYIFLLDFQGNGEEAHEELINSPGWDSLQAVKNDNLKVLEVKYLMNPNTQVIEGLRLMADWIYEEKE
ncbi:iron complex transport system substrate-binding protein [Pseudogracilibacillus auburnensis]|uniref:Iron complex transport system substrate-binding protein n=2 Tax=Pseudogracilibacillus auburnensis TaxID=1494959 RepID=A0A2V3VRF1_9BACI|nr:iron complex transport system substrate-binding protein [Pseudogracilibacillus auburnensis]